jgi:hypothetical protein
MRSEGKLTHFRCKSAFRKALSWSTALWKALRTHILGVFFTTRHSCMGKCVRWEASTVVNSRREPSERMLMVFCSGIPCMQDALKLFM